MSNSSSHPHSTTSEPLGVKGVVLGEEIEELEDAALHREALILLERTHHHLTQVVVLH